MVKKYVKRPKRIKTYSYKRKGKVVKVPSHDRTYKVKNPNFAKRISFEEAKEIHAQRSARSRAIDEKSTAKQTYDIPYGYWILFPDRYDIKGIDDKQPNKRVAESDGSVEIGAWRTLKNEPNKVIELFGALNIDELGVREGEGQKGWKHNWVDEDLGKGYTMSYDRKMLAYVDGHEYGNDVEKFNDVASLKTLDGLKRAVSLSSDGGKRKFIKTKQDACIDAEIWDDLKKNYNPATITMQKERDGDWAPFLFKRKDTPIKIAVAPLNIDLDNVHTSLGYKDIILNEKTYKQYSKLNKDQLHDFAIKNDLYSKKGFKKDAMIYEIERSYKLKKSSRPF